MTNTVTLIKEFNAGRDPERLALKYRKMRADAFTFLRGTCHLFHHRLPEAAVLEDAPLAWISGDLHLENFGTFKAEDKQVYFDVNDFDESALAPCTHDLVRLLTSILVARTSFSLDRSQASALCLVFLDAYAEALKEGKPSAIDRDSATGLVRQLLDDLRGRNRQDFLDSRTELKGRERRIRTDGKKALPANAMQRARVEEFMREFARHQPEPDRYQVLDVARRIAGTGSLGIERYVILIEGKGSPDRNNLLDLKESLHSSLLSGLKTAQPNWQSEAHRIVAVQQRVRAEAVSFLHPLSLGKTPCVLRVLQPSEDRVALEEWKKFSQLEGASRSMAKVVASGHLRACDWLGSASVHEMIDFGARRDCHKQLINVVEDCASQAEKDWQEYVAAFDDGLFA